MAPEVIKESRYPHPSPHKLNPAAADLWSFGITLIELLKGRPPLHYLSPSAAMGMIPSTSPPRLESSDPHASKMLRDLIHACLHDDPQKRPTAQQLLKQYKNYFKAQRGQQSNILTFLKKKSISKDASESKQSTASVQVQAGEGNIDFSTVLSGWDFEIGSTIYTGQEDFESFSQDVQILSHNSSLPGTPKDTQIRNSDFSALTPFHDRATPKFALRSVNSDSLSASLSFNSTKILDQSSSIAPSIFKANCNWNRKDRSILPIPPPLNPPDLSRPQYEVVANAMEANGKDKQVLRLMRLYLTEEDRRDELSLQLKRIL